MRAGLFFVTPIYRVLTVLYPFIQFCDIHACTRYHFLGVQNDPQNNLSSLGLQPDFLNTSKPCTSTIALCVFLKSPNQTRTIADHNFPDLGMSIPKHLKGLEIGARCHETGSSPPT